jgi:hypothetical protein
VLAEKKRLFGKRFLHVTVTVSNTGSEDKDVAVFLSGYDQDWTQVIFVAGLKPLHMMPCRKMAAPNWSEPITSEKTN